MVWDSRTSTKPEVRPIGGVHTPRLQQQIRSWERLAIATLATVRTAFREQVETRRKGVAATRVETHGSIFT